MLFPLSLTTLLVLLAPAVQANPLPSTEVAAVSPGTAVSLPAIDGFTYPIESLSTSRIPPHPADRIPPLASTGPAPASLSKRSDSAHSLAARQAIFPATLYTCASPGCTNCLTWDLQNRNFGNCYFAGAFVSVGIVQPGNVGFPWNINIAPGNCTNWLTIPAVNTCYNINVPFSQFGANARGA